MKRKITSLTTAIIVLFLILFTLPETGWGQTRTEEVVYTLDGTSTGGSNGYGTASDITQNNIAWKVTANTTVNPWRFGGNSITSVDRPAYTTSTLTNNNTNITKVVVTTGTANITVNSVKLIVADNANFNNATTLTESWAASSTITFNRPNNANWTDKYFKIVYNVTNSSSSNKYAEFKKAEFYAETGGGGGTTYTVTYNANDGSQTPATFSHTGQQAGTYTVLANDPESNENPSFTYTGHTFSTWNTKDDGSGTDYDPADNDHNSFNLTVSTTLYAKWTANIHIITMPSNAYGTYSAASNAASGDYEYGSTITLTYNPAEGYNGYSAIWSINGTPIVGNTFTMPDTDVTVTAEVAVFIDDVLDRAKTGVTNGSTTYTSWSGKTSNSQAVYAGKTAGNYNSIQMNNTTGNGIITTASGGKVKSISVDWNSNTSSGRYITIYGSNTAFTSIDMSSASSLGTIKMGTNTSLVITSDYEYIGIVANGALYLNSINIKWKPSTVATPTFDPDGEAYIGTQHVTIGCTTTGATIYYTTNGSLPTKDAEGTYTYVNNTTVDIATTTTLKARAYKEGEYSALKSATYTITQPFTTMQAIYDDAMTNTAEHTVYITFGNNWVISGANSSSHAFLTDGTKGCIIYASSHGFSAGDILSGTVQCKSQKYNGAVELTELTSNTSGLTVNTGGTVTVADIEMADLVAVNTGALVSYSNLTCSKETSGNYTNYYLTDGTTTVQAYKTLLDNYADYLSNGKTYDITGVFVLNNSTLRINPRTSADIVLKADMSSTDFSNLTAFSYVLNQGPSAAQHIEVYCDDLGTNTLRATAPEGYEVCLTEDGDYAAYVDMTPSQSSVAVDLYVRLAAGHNEGTYNGNLSFTAATLDAVNVPLQGSVSTVATYAISLVQTTGGTIAADMSVASEGTTVTLSYSDVDDCYNFTGWTVYKTGDQSTTEDVDENGQFEMPGYPVTATATFTQKKFTVNYSVNGTIESDLVHANITCGNNASLWDEDDLEAASVELPSGFSLAGWSTSAGSTETVDSFTPSEDATLYAVLVPAGTGYQLITSTSQITAGKYLFAALRANELPESIEYSIATGSISSGDIVVTSDKHAPNTNNIYTTVPSGGVEFELSGNNSDGFTICYDSKYLGYTSATSSRALAFDKDYSTIMWKFYALDNGLSTGALYMQNYQNNKYYTVSENSTGTGAIRGYAGETKYRGFYLFKKIEAIPYTHVYTGSNNATADINIEGPTLITSGSVLNMNGQTLTCDNPANLIIEDGAQLICDNSVAATFKKTMPTPAAPSTKDEPEDVYGWELISSPVHDDNGSTIEVTNVTNLTTSTYDMFAYDEVNVQWLNQKANDNPATVGFNTLNNGQGYMYRNNAQELSFVGNTNVATFTKDLTYTTGAGDLAGFHLVGNPYSEDITLMNTTLFNDDGALGNDKQLSAYYILKDNGSAWKTDLAANTPIANKQGFLIEIPSNATKIQFSRTARTAKSHGDNIKFMVANSQFEDVTYALFDKALPLNKINHRNPEVPMIYINQNDQDYAVATMTDDTKAFNLGFKAGTMGKYTLSYKADGNFNYIHVIDRMTSEDIDMLLEGEYSFIGTPNDNVNRFIVKLGYNAGNEISENEIFAYQSGNDIVVSGEGELQIFDVTGRRVMTTTINGAESINIPAQGVYIFKLNEKVQKIVVR